jgi:3-dehydroquinate synthase
MTPSLQEVPDGIETVRVELGQRSYPILIGPGLLPLAPRILRGVLPDVRFAIVADEALRTYAEDLEERLGNEGLLLGKTCFVPTGESSKSFADLERVCLSLLDLGIERSHGVIALGGGVVGDLAGFASGILKRGVRLVQIPTTLLAQVDSAVGGKTGINTRHGKNLIGVFHQPSLVLSSLDVFDTLPPREFRAGYAEIVKYGALGDARFFAWLDERREAVFARDVSALTHAIKISCEMKASIVGRDELETGDRALLNLGHTFGHSVEAWAGYSGAVLHGEAVALGMVLAAEFSVRQGLCAAETVARLKDHLDACGFATDFSQLERQTGRRPTLNVLLHYMEQDKKVSGGAITLILLRGIGEAFVEKNVPREAIAGFLRDRLAV